jgi:hypothetical protein
MLDAKERAIRKAIESFPVWSESADLAGRQRFSVRHDDQGPK